MAKKDLRAQMDAARAATAFIGAAQEAQLAHGEPAGEDAAAAQEAEAPSSKDASKTKRTSRRVKNAALDVTLPAAVPDFFTYGVAEAPSTAPVEGELLGTSSGFAADTAAVPGGQATRAARAIFEEEVPQPAFRGGEPLSEAPSSAVAPKAKAARSRKPRKKAPAVSEAPVEEEAASARMTAQVLVPMTAEQREHADLLAQVKKVTRAEVMRQALDEYWDNHKSDLQAAVEAYEQLIRKLMK